MKTESWCAGTGGANFSRGRQPRFAGAARAPTSLIATAATPEFGFDGTETASRKPYRELAKTIPGPTASLMDAESLCAFARFCDPNGKVWNLVKETDDAERKCHFVRQTCDCPSGRLVAVDNATGEAIEPHYEPSLALIEDPAEGCSGPLWVRGGVRLVSSDGFEYERRNRVTLCRCGASKNKPFCDGSHAAIKFKDGI